MSIDLTQACGMQNNPLITAQEKTQASVIEAPQPQAVRRRDLVKSQAMMHGYNVLCAETHALISYENWLAAVDAYELYRAAHDRRGKK